MCSIQTKCDRICIVYLMHMVSIAAVYKFSSSVAVNPVSSS